MTAKWGSCAILVLCLALSACRTPQPDLKPANSKETLIEPPRGGRLDTGEFPKTAFDKQTDPARIGLDSKAIIPAKGASLPGTGNMSPTGR